MGKKGKPKIKSGAEHRDGNKGGKGKKHNPFEIHINRVKHDVVGRKNKLDRGLPGISRAKAFKKRERTLLQEYKVRHKSNVFLDKRIGENDVHMDPEKKLALRLAAEKRRQFGKKSLFNLNEDEELTHAGELLNDFNLNDKLGISDDDDDDDMLDAKFVKEQHFGGGGLLTRRDGATGDTDKDKPKSKKEWIDEIIAESKKKKAESKKEKEEQYEAVHKLNSELQSFMKLMGNHTMTKDDKDNAQKNCEFSDYDTLVKELIFDRTGKAKAVEKLKTPEELISEERERLLALEADRVRRMKGEKPTSEHKVAKSADDLDDGFSLPEDHRYHVSYMDGEILTHENDENDEDDDDDDDDKEEETRDTEKTESDEDEEEEEKEEEAKQDLDEDENDTDEDEDSDKYSDILEESESEDEEMESESKTKPREKKVKFKKKREVMEAAKKEIPYTFEVPQDYDAFWALLEHHSPEEVGLILERMITCNHPSLGGRNKEKCDDMFAFILQTLHTLTEEEGEGESLREGVSPFMYVDHLVPPLYTITQVTPVNSANSLLQVIEEKYEACRQSKFKRYPSASTFVFLKVAGVLFPSSDFIHPVMTPVMVFLCQLLNQAKVTTRRDITAAMFTAHLLYEYVSLSKRFVPEVINTMNGLVFMSVREQQQDKTRLPLTAPFKCVGPTSSLLVLERQTATQFSESKLLFSNLNKKSLQIDDEFRINVFYKAVKLLNVLAKCWIGLPSIRAVLTPTNTLLKAVSMESYPDDVKKVVQEFLSQYESLPSEGNPLVREEKKPTAIKMYEPAIEKIIDGVKKRHGTKEYLEKQKLIHKLKREKKGARREIQRDTAFLAHQKLQETLKSDAERKRKIGQIMSGLQMQEGDFKKLKKKS